MPPGNFPSAIANGFQQAISAITSDFGQAIGTITSDFRQTKVLSKAVFRRQQPVDGRRFHEDRKGTPVLSEVLSSGHHFFDALVPLRSDSSGSVSEWE